MLHRSKDRGVRTTPSEPGHPPYCIMEGDSGPPNRPSLGAILSSLNKGGSDSISQGGGVAHAG